MVKIHRDNSLRSDSRSVYINRFLACKYSWYFCSWCRRTFYFCGRRKKIGFACFVLFLLWNYFYYSHTKFSGTKTAEILVNDRNVDVENIGGTIRDEEPSTPLKLVQKIYIDRNNDNIYSNKAKEKQSNTQNLQSLHKNSDGDGVFFPPSFAFLSKLSEIIGDDASSSSAWTRTTEKMIDLQKFVNSDIVQLDHCSLHKIPWNRFIKWSIPILNNIREEQEKKDLDIVRVVSNDNSDETATDTKALMSILDDAIIQEELTLQLLEIYLTHNQLCNFSSYHQQYISPSSSFVLSFQKQAKMIQSTTDNVRTPPRLVRIVFVIIAYHDVKQLQYLLESIHMSHHIIIIHVDNNTSIEFIDELEKFIATEEKFQRNVVMLQFGTIIYETDAISNIQLIIMRWLLDVVKIQYDYHITLCGSTFPLHNNYELAQYLYSKKNTTNVWLGELLDHGKYVNSTVTSQMDRIVRKRLSITRKRSNTIVGTTSSTIRIGKVFPSKSYIYGKYKGQYRTIFNSMKYKSTSGNQAIFSYDIIRSLLDSKDVMQLFALSKYGCCCCLEENNWIAAISIIGQQYRVQQQTPERSNEIRNKSNNNDEDRNFHSLLESALKHTSMFQVWGFSGPLIRNNNNNAVDNGFYFNCQQERVITSSGTVSIGSGGTTMKNAVLSTNLSLCYRLEDAYIYHANFSDRHFNRISADIKNGGDFVPELIFRGNETLNYLSWGKKQRRYLFARKFSSNHKQSMDLLQEITQLKI